GNLQNVDVDLTTALLLGSRSNGGSLPVEDSGKSKNNHKTKQKLGAHGRDYSIPRSACSSMIDTPYSRALSSLDPGSAPATRKVVFLLTDDVTRPPHSSLRVVP